MGLRDATNRRLGGGESTKLLGILDPPWQGYEKKHSKIEVYAGMAKPMVRDLAIKEALQEEI